MDKAAMRQAELDLAELVMQMTLADFIAPLVGRSENSPVELLIEVSCQDGTVRTVKLKASLVKSWWARMRAQYSGSKPLIRPPEKAA